MQSYDILPVKNTLFCVALCVHMHIRIPLTHFCIHFQIRIELSWSLTLRCHIIIHIQCQGIFMTKSIEVSDAWHLYKVVQI